MRHIETGEQGLQLDDLVVSLDKAFTAAASFLSPENCHNHLGDIPQDAQVARVERNARSAVRAHNYYTAEVLNG